MKLSKCPNCGTEPDLFFVDEFETLIEVQCPNCNFNFNEAIINPSNQTVSDDIRNRACEIWEKNINNYR